jgi:hypothetical protein
MIWQAILVGFLVTALGVWQSYLFIHRNIQGKGDWDEPVEDEMDEALYRGPACVLLLVMGIILLAVGFLR